MGKIICTANQKGGVGKTTTVVNLGMGLKSHGKSILLVDLDPQANLTSSIGMKNRSFESTVYDLLKGEAGLEETVIVHQGVHVIPSSIELSGAEIELSTVPGRELLLKEALTGVTGRYDAVLIDCPPSLGLLTLNALTAAQQLLIPIQPEYLSLEGVRMLLSTVEIVRKRLNKSLELSGVIVTMYDSRQNLDREVKETIREHFKEKVFKTLIRKNVALAEAPGFGRDIYQYKPDSVGARDYTELCREIIRREVV